MNELNKKKNKNSDNKNYILRDNLECFGLNKIFINKFLTGLWNYPEAMYQILNHSEPRDIKESLASLVVDNFYTNYLSGNYIENNLLYILALMLRDEIEKLTDIEEVETFLDNSRCGYLLEELQKKPDVQLFFNKVILKTVEKVESLCSYREIKFNVAKIVNEFEKLKDEYEKGEKKAGVKSELNLGEDLYKKLVSNKLDQSINYCRDENLTGGKIKEDNEFFVKKFVPNITKKEFENRALTAKNDNNIDLFNYFNRFAQDIKNSCDEDLYSNSNLMGNLLNTKSPPTILTFYRTDFMQVVNFIEQLINDLIENILLLPYSVKCICKIISVLIRNKFKGITKAEENGFISKFILGRLLIPIISSPSFNALISEFVISGNTIKNVELINIIISKLFSGNLFKNINKEDDYTPFNWIFLDKMEKILCFFENATNVYLPDFIEKFINKNLPKDYEYNFFKENKEEMYANISICFNIRYLSLLIEGVRKSPDIFNKSKKSDKLEKAFKKLEDEDTFKAIKKADQNNLNNENNKKHRLSVKQKIKDKIITNEDEIYYLHNDKAIEEKDEILFKLDNKIANFYIDLKEKEKKTKLNEEEKNIIKVKNYLSNSIGNYRLLNIADFHKEATSDTIKMLNEIKAYMALPNFILNNNTIPSTWYINSLLDYLKKIPEDYKKNEYEKLYKELTKDLNDSINILDFQKLIIFRNKLKFIDKINNYYENVYMLINKIAINEKIKEMVEKIFIPVEMSFRYIEEENDNFFDLKSSNVKEKEFEDKMIYENKKKGVLAFRTIESFTSHFPNLAQYQVYQDKNPLEIIQELKIPGKINNYFEIIKKCIRKEEKITEEEYENKFQEKIKDYIMNKIYEKIYPFEPLDLDTKIFRTANMLSWVEPQLIVEKEYIYDNILPDIINEFQKIHKVKTPLKKVKCIRQIFVLIQSLIQFNEGENKTLIGSDDITPVLNYAFIKAAPFRIYTDLEFVKIFLEIKEGQGGYDINQLESAYTMLLSYKPENFKLTPQEFNKNCTDARNSIIII
jgi:hypothetical protein